jgi:acetyl esterase/lipase
MLVVSLDYRKAPLHPFPTATYDIAALANAVLADETLPIDKSRVAIGGFSAGGNLALSASQLPGLKGTVKAAVVYYPVVDFSLSPSEKLAARPYKGGPRDRFGDASWWLDWGYVRVGQNRRDTLISPCYARKENLPPWIYIIGAQWDMFRLEAQVMMHTLAGLEDKEDPEASFEKDTYKWTLATGCSHGFTHSRKRDPGKRSKNEQKCEEIYREAHRWLKKSVLEG